MKIDEKFVKIHENWENIFANVGTGRQGWFMMTFLNVFYSPHISIATHTKLFSLKLLDSCEER